MPLVRNKNTSQQTQTHLQLKTMLSLHTSPASTTHAQHAILLYTQGICMHNNVLDCELAISCRWSDTSCTATPHPKPTDADTPNHTWAHVQPQPGMHNTPYSYKINISLLLWMYQKMAVRSQLVGQIQADKWTDPNWPTVQNQCMFAHLPSLNQARATRQTLIQSIYLYHHEYIRLWASDLVPSLRYMTHKSTLYCDPDFLQTLLSTLNHTSASHQNLIQSRYICYPNSKKIAEVQHKPLSWNMRNKNHSKTHQPRGNLKRL